MCQYVLVPACSYTIYNMCLDRYGLILFLVVLDTRFVPFLTRFSVILKLLISNFLATTFMNKMLVHTSSYSVIFSHSFCLCVMAAQNCLDPLHSNPKIIFLQNPNITELGGLALCHIVSATDLLFVFTLRG